MLRTFQLTVEKKIPQLAHDVIGKYLCQFANDVKSTYAFLRIWQFIAIA